MSRSQSHTDDPEAQSSSSASDQPQSVAPSLDEIEDPDAESEDVFSGFDESPVFGETGDDTTEADNFNSDEASADVPEPEPNPEPSDSLADLFEDPDEEDTQPEYGARPDEPEPSTQESTRTPTNSKQDDSGSQSRTSEQDSAGGEASTHGEEIKDHVEEEQQRRESRRRSRQQKYEEILSGTERGPRLRGSSNWAPSADSETLARAQPETAETVLSDDVAEAIDSINVDGPRRARNVFDRIEPPTAPGERLRNAVDTAVGVIGGTVLTALHSSLIFAVGCVVLMIAGPLLVGARLLKPALPYIAGFSLIMLATALFGTWVVPADVYGTPATLETQIAATISLTGVLGGTAFVATVLESYWEDDNGPSFEGVLA